MKTLDISFNNLQLGDDEQYYISKNLLNLEILTANNLQCPRLTLEMFTLPKLIELYVESSHIQCLSFDLH